MTVIFKRRGMMPYRPTVFYYVEGRRMFAREIPLAIRRVWRVGRYHISRDRNQ